MRRILANVVSASALFSLASAAHAVPSFYWANPRPTGSDVGGVDFESATIGYAVGTFGTSLRTTDGGVTWEDRTNLVTIGPDLHDVLVLSPGVLLAAGAQPGLHRSTDGGSSWSPVANPANAPLRNLFALDAATLFAVGDLGRVVRSTNAGATWTLLGAPSSTELSDQWWLDASNGYVVGQSCIRRTTNGGGTWSTIPNITENSFFGGDIQFVGTQDGWIFTDFDTFRTTNGGGTWTKIPAAIGLFPIYQEEAIILGPQTRLVATEAEGATIGKTTDDGHTWTFTLQHLGTRGVTDLEQLPGGAIVATTSDGDLLRSTDVGATWTNFTDVAGPPERENMNVIDIHASGLGFAGGWDHVWIQTTDGGRTWFDPPANPGLQIINAIVIRDGSFILAGGTGSPGHSDVRRSTDGGATWTTHLLSASYVGYPEGLVAFPDGTCFCVTYGGTNVNFAYRSTDGGETWQLRNSGLSASIRAFDLFFLDPQRGFVCGGTSNPSIYRTTDGGGLWTPVGEAGLLGDEIRDMHWFDENVGLVVNFTRVQRTTDGGGTWSTALNGSSGIAIDFLDALHGVTCSYDNTVATTTDGGVTWTPGVVPMPGYLGDVAMTPTGYLAVGSSNSIVGFDSGAGPVAAEEMASLAPSTRRLALCPNPVRIGATPSLSFRVEGGAFAAIEARLYDVGGRLLARSALGAGLSAGSLSLENADLRPGVVFLELRGVGGTRLGSKVAVIR